MIIIKIITITITTTTTILLFRQWSRSKFVDHWVRYLNQARSSDFQIELVIIESRLIINPNHCKFEVGFIRRFLANEYNSDYKKELFYKEFFEKIKQEFHKNIELNYKIFDSLP